MRDGAANRAIILPYNVGTLNPRGLTSTVCEHNVISPLFSPIIAEMALSCLSDSHRGRKPILSGLQGTWRAIRQPDIFLEKSPAERELLRVQLTTSRSDFSRELTLEKKILRHSFFLLVPSQLHTHISSPHLV